ncbi:hypothetical protein [Chryseobacterium luteum]|uniref:Uncharacterized protein n=1 Tax=Chryseobacterium luteum TaxID=421531 RepID=A0A085ZB52_9FLAO|nr:hypothetical protein [Chryseobacterium luteum]KFF01666.1 hypothetical protein IX38_16470 [Chryseobacterium luteum]
MTTKEIFEIIEEELYMTVRDFEIEEDRIFWKDAFGAEIEICKYSTAINNQGVFAWWQSNEVGHELVRIKINRDTIINWRPPINTMGQPSSGGYLQFFENSLVTQYLDKHGERLFIFNVHTLKAEEIITKGFRKKIKLNGNELFVADSYENEFIKISIYPDRLEREEIDEAYLDRRNIKFD